MIRALAPAALAVLVAGAACHRDEPAPAPPTAPVASDGSAAAAATDDGDACAIVTGRTLIEGVVLESADGACRLYLSSEAGPGELAVRISAAGDPSAAAIERDAEDGTLYDNAGTVTLTTAGDGRWVGTFDADDHAAPATGSISGTIDVTLTP